MKEKPWINKVHDNCAGIRSIAHELEELADSFYRTGNRDVAEQLGGLANALLQHETGVIGSIGEMLHDQVQKGQGQVLSVLQAVMGREENK